MPEPPDPTPSIRQTVASYYAERLRAFGATAAGVDWRSAESQALRFDRLLQLLDRDGEVSLNDYGCGYGALLDHLQASGRRVVYRGFDISAAMVRAAQARHAQAPDCSFTEDAAALAPADYTVASGIFNVKLAHPVAAWRDYVMETLAALDALSTRGFAFNMLSTHSDEDKRRADLYYADPAEMFETCSRRFSPRVALLHDYPLYEFTMLVRK